LLNILECDTTKKMFKVLGEKWVSKAFYILPPPLPDKENRRLACAKSPEHACNLSYMGDEDERIMVQGQPR
jgi:hypothetical protein